MLEGQVGVIGVGIRQCIVTALADVIMLKTRFCFARTPTKHYAYLIQFNFSRELDYQVNVS